MHTGINRRQVHPLIRFYAGEFNIAMKHLKNGKAAGPDDILTEMLVNLGEKRKSWLLGMFNNCLTTCNIPPIWRKAKVVAILKPGNDPLSPKSYRPISVLCISFKLFERLILTRRTTLTEEKLIKDQAGFRPGKSCSGQLLNLTRYIEDGFQKRLITGAAFVDLTAAYDTVQHRLMIKKLFDLTLDLNFCKIIQTLLANRRSYVMFNGKKSQWFNLKNGLPQGSVLSRPCSIYIHTNDQPLPPKCSRFIYADDLCLTTQQKAFPDIENIMEKALSVMSAYYQENHLKANQSKTQLCSFHLNNKQAKRQLKVTWDGLELENHPYPVYLGVTLDRTLSYRKHIIRLKSEISTRNNLLRKLTNSKWGADPNTIRVSALGLCYSVAEYACSTWSRSCHTQKIDTSLNETCRINHWLYKNYSQTLPTCLGRNSTTRYKKYFYQQ